jgi:hypothetical protein
MELFRKFWIGNKNEIEKNVENVEKFGDYNTTLFKTQNRFFFGSEQEVRVFF